MVDQRYKPLLLKLYSLCLGCKRSLVQIQSRRPIQPLKITEQFNKILGLFRWPVIATNSPLLPVKADASGGILVDHSLCHQCSTLSDFPFTAGRPLTTEKTIAQTFLKSKSGGIYGESVHRYWQMG